MNASRGVNEALNQIGYSMVSISHENDAWTLELQNCDGANYEFHSYIDVNLDRLVFQTSHGVFMRFYVNRVDLQARNSLYLIAKAASEQLPNCLPEYARAIQSTLIKTQENEEMQSKDWGIF